MKLSSRRFQGALGRLEEQLLHDFFQFYNGQLLCIVEVLPVAFGIPASKTIPPDFARAGARFAEVLVPPTA